MKHSKLIRRCAIAAFIIALVFLAKYYHLGDYLSLSYMQKKSFYLQSLVQKHYLASAVSYIVIFTLMTISTIPGMALLAIVAGFLFGVVLGTLYTVIGGTLGSVLSVIIFRFFFQEQLQQRYASKLRYLNAQFEQYGAYYLLMLQFMTIVPFFVINSISALANIPLLTVAWTTAVGFTPLATAYCFAGQQLQTLKSMSDIFSWPIIIAFLVLITLAFAPILLKKQKKMSL